MKQIVVTLDRPEIRKVEDSGDTEKVAEVRGGPSQGPETAPVPPEKPGARSGASQPVRPALVWQVRVVSASPLPGPAGIAPQRGDAAGPGRGSSWRA